jgi:CRP-like cAMP-binding protein
MLNLPARTRSFAHGETLLQAGADHEVGFVILSGLVELRRDTSKLVENAEQGTVIGAVSLLFGGAQKLNDIAKGPVEAATIDRATVSAQLSRNPELVREFTSMLLGRL